jgi:hypothetical protein
MCTFAESNSAGFLRNVWGTAMVTNVQATWRNLPARSHALIVSVGTFADRRANRQSDARAGKDEETGDGVQGLWFDAGCVWDLSASGTGIGETDLFTNLLRQISRNAFKRGTGAGNCRAQPHAEFAPDGIEHPDARYRRRASTGFRPSASEPVLSVVEGSGFFGAWEIETYYFAASGFSFKNAALSVCFSCATGSSVG